MTGYEVMITYPELDCRFLTCYSYVPTYIDDNDGKEVCCHATLELIPFLSLEWFLHRLFFARAENAPYFL